MRRDESIPEANELDLGNGPPIPFFDQRCWKSSLVTTDSTIEESL